jgi:amphi-Trp domain-containing protein
MDLIEIARKERLSREEVARRLHALADDLARHNDVELDRGGTHLKLKVPDLVNLKFELEIEDDGTELEIELSW